MVKPIKDKVELELNRVVNQGVQWRVRQQAYQVERREVYLEVYQELRR